MGVARPSRKELPRLIVVGKEDQDTARDRLWYLMGELAEWWMPDDVIFVDDLPHTATGKLQKMRLREQFKSYQFPTA
jgi:fatty-acyl-CoA synthase